MAKLLQADSAAPRKKEDTMKNKQRVTIYSDGACPGNPGPGGYGVVVLTGGERRELSGGYRLTTNSRMEMLAAIVGLEALPAPSSVTIYSDSKFLVDSVNQGWAIRWRANGWKRNKREKALNVDLWEKLLDLCSLHDVEFVWIKGHSGIEENERTDRLAVAAATQGNLPADDVYERTIEKRRAA